MTRSSAVGSAAISERSAPVSKRSGSGCALTLASSVWILAVRFAVVTAAQAERIQIEAAKTEEVKNYIVGLFERAKTTTYFSKESAPRWICKVTTLDTRCR